MSNNSLLTLPDRKISLSGGTGARSGWTIIGVLFILAITIFLAVWQVPGIQRDWQISQNPVVLHDGNVRNGECNWRKGLTTCSADLSYSYKGQSYDVPVELAFLDIHTGDYSVDIVISATRPELATITLGLEKLWNRIIVLAVLVGILMAVAFAALIRHARASRQDRLLLRPGKLDVVPVRIVHSETAGRRLNLKYAYQTAAGKTRQASTTFARGTAPLGVVDHAGQTLGIAVMHERSSVPVLLDTALRRLDLSEEERKAAIDSLGSDTRQAERATKARAPRSVLKPILAGIAVLLLIFVGVMGYWLWYVTSGSTAFDPIGMEVNAMLPGAMNEWGCDRLEERFGDENAPYGCTASDYVSWK